MKRISEFAFAVLVFCAVSVHAADWEVLQTQAEQTMLVDKNSIHRDGEIWKAWAVESYGKTMYLGEPVFPHRSRVVLYQVDCAAGELGYAAWSFQSGELGGGMTVWADTANGVAYFPPDRGSPEEALLLRVCATMLAREAER
jgi:hypothetical protein